MNAATQVQILDETVLHIANPFGKGMNPTILPPGMVNNRANKALQTSLGEEKLWTETS